MLSIQLDESLAHQIEIFSNHNQTKAALKQSERIARFEKNTDYIESDITGWE